MCIDNDLLAEIDMFYLTTCKDKHFFSFGMEELQSHIKTVLHQLEEIRNLGTKIKGYLYEASSQYRKMKHELKCQSCSIKRLESCDTTKNNEEMKLEHIYDHILKTAGDDKDFDEFDKNLANALYDTFNSQEAKEHNRRKSHVMTIIGELKPVIVPKLSKNPTSTQSIPDNHNIFSTQTPNINKNEQAHYRIPAKLGQPQNPSRKRSVLTTHDSDNRMHENNGKLITYTALDRDTSLESQLHTTKLTKRYGNPNINEKFNDFYNTLPENVIRYHSNSVEQVCDNKKSVYNMSTGKKMKVKNSELENYLKSTKFINVPSKINKNSEPNKTILLPPLKNSNILKENDIMNSGLKNEKQNYQTSHPRLLSPYNDNKLYNRKYEEHINNSRFQKENISLRMTDLVISPRLTNELNSRHTDNKDSSNSIYRKTFQESHKA